MIKFKQTPILFFIFCHKEGHKNLNICLIIPKMKKIYYIKDDKKSIIIIKIIINLLMNRYDQLSFTQNVKFVRIYLKTH